MLAGPARARARCRHQGHRPRLQAAGAGRGPAGARRRPGDDDTGGRDLPRRRSGLVQRRRRPWREHAGRRGRHGGGAGLGTAAPSRKGPTSTRQPAASSTTPRGAWRRASASSAASSAAARSATRRSSSCQAAGIRAWSNTPVAGNPALDDIRVSREHTMVDMGDDDFTQGRPHPMIDPSLRNERIERDAADPATAVLLVDVVLGYGSAADPTSRLTEVLDRARSSARNAGRHLAVIAHVCGTDADPQNRKDTIARLAGRRCAGGLQQCRSRRLGRLPRHPTGGTLRERRCTNCSPRSCASSTSACRASPRTSSAPAATRSQLAWRPPAGGDVDTGLTLARMINDPRVENANRTAFARYLDAQPVLVDVVLAREAVPALARRAPGPARRPADRLGRHVRPGAGRHRRGHRLRGLGRVARRGDGAGRGRQGRARARATTTAPSDRWPGIISPSMPLWVVENAAAGNRAFCNFNEGLGKVLRFGANGPAVIERLQWMGDRALTPVMRAAVRATRPPRTQAADRARRCTWATRCTTATPPPPDCCSSGCCRRCSPPTPASTGCAGSSSSSPATITSSSTCRWRRARPCSTPRPACPAARW